MPVEDSFPCYLRSINKRQQRSSGVRNYEHSNDLNHSDDRESKVLGDIGITMARNSDEPVVAVIRSDFTVIRCNGVSIGENILRSSCLPLAGTKVGNKEASESHANAHTRVHTHVYRHILAIQSSLTFKVDCGRPVKIKSQLYERR